MLFAVLDIATGTVIWQCKPLHQTFKNFSCETALGLILFHCRKATHRTVGREAFSRPLRVIWLLRVVHAIYSVTAPVVSQPPHTLR